MVLVASAVATQYKEQMAYCLWGQIPQDWSVPPHLSCYTATGWVDGIT